MHYLSIIATFKNESWNMAEFLDHYLWQGVEHFYLINNGSTDDFMPIIEKYKDKITLYDMPKRWAQVDNTNTVFREVKDKTFWFGIVDFDEFIYGTKERIVDFLRPREEYSRVICPWLLFGTCPQPEHPKSVRKGFIRRQAGHHHDAKCFSRSDKTTSVHIHTHYYTDENYLMETEQLRHNHYNIQSYEFWKNVKNVRGAADGQSQEFVRTWEMFHERAAQYGQIEDTILHDMVVKLEKGENPYGS